MSSSISHSGGDWLFKDFFGEDRRWCGSYLPETRDRRHWRIVSAPGCPYHDLWRLGEIPDPSIERNSLLCEWISQRTWLYKKTLNGPARMLVQKSGSFGKPDFFERALEHLKEP